MRSATWKVAVAVGVVVILAGAWLAAGPLTRSGTPELGETIVVPDRSHAPEPSDSAPTSTPASTPPSTTWPPGPPSTPDVGASVLPPPTTVCEAGHPGDDDDLADEADDDDDPCD